MRIEVRAAFVGVAIALSALTAGAQQVGTELREALAHARHVPVVVALRAGGEAQPEAVRTLQERVLARLRASDFAPGPRFEALPFLAGELTVDGLARLRADPAVVRIDLDVPGGGGLRESVPLVRADAARGLGITGKGVVVAVVDSGIDAAHPDLADDLVGEHCICRGSDGLGCCPDGSVEQDGPGSARDEWGHGTHVAGIVTSAGRVAVPGVAPDAKILALRVLDASGRFAASSQIVAGLDWLLVHRPDVRIVNLSLGTDQLFDGACDQATAFTMAFASAVERLHARGTLVFAASMNGGSATQIASPACLARTISVGAVQDAQLSQTTRVNCTDAPASPDLVTCFTNSNATLDLVAPGSSIVSTALGGSVEARSGTSMATPHAAGVAALLLEAMPAASADQVEQALKASPASARDPKNGLSFPRVDALAALNALTARPASASTER